MSSICLVSCMYYLTAISACSALDEFPTLAPTSKDLDFKAPPALNIKGLDLNHPNSDLKSSDLEKEETEAPGLNNFSNSKKTEVGKKGNAISFSNIKQIIEFFLSIAQ